MNKFGIGISLIGVGLLLLFIYAMIKDDTETTKENWLKKHCQPTNKIVIGLYSGHAYMRYKCDNGQVYIDRLVK